MSANAPCAISYLYGIYIYLCGISLGTLNAIFPKPCTDVTSIAGAGHMVSLLVSEMNGRARKYAVPSRVRLAIPHQTRASLVDLPVGLVLRSNLDPNRQQYRLPSSLSLTLYCSRNTVKLSSVTCRVTACQVLTCATLPALSTASSYLALRTAASSSR